MSIAFCIFVKTYKCKHLELNHLSFAFFVTSQFKMLGTLDGNLIFPFAFHTFHTQHQLFGCFSLLSQNGLGLTTETLLLTIITSTTLRLLRFLGLLVLSHLEHFVALAVRMGTESSSFLGNVHHFEEMLNGKGTKTSC